MGLMRRGGMAHQSIRKRMLILVSELGIPIGKARRVIWATGDVRGGLMTG